MSTPDPAVSVEKHGLEVRIAGGEVHDALADRGRLDINFPGVVGEANQGTGEDDFHGRTSSR